MQDEGLGALSLSQASHSSARGGNSAACASANGQGGDGNPQAGDALQLFKSEGDYQTLEFVLRCED